MTRDVDENPVVVEVDRLSGLIQLGPFFVFLFLKALLSVQFLDTEPLADVSVYVLVEVELVRNQISLILLLIVDEPPGEVHALEHVSVGDLMLVSDLPEREIGHLLERNQILVDHLLVYDIHRDFDIDTLAIHRLVDILDLAERLDPLEAVVIRVEVFIPHLFLEQLLEVPQRPEFVSDLRRVDKFGGHQHLLLQHLHLADVQLFVFSCGFLPCFLVYKSAELLREGKHLAVAHDVFLREGHVELAVIVAITGGKAVGTVGQHFVLKVPQLLQVLVHEWAGGVEEIVHVLQFSLIVTQLPRDKLYEITFLVGEELLLFLLH